MEIRGTAGNATAGGWRGGVWIGGPRIVIGGGCVARKHVNRNSWVVKRRYC